MLLLKKCSCTRLFEEKKKIGNYFFKKKKCNHLLRTFNEKRIF